MTLIPACGNGEGDSSCPHTPIIFLVLLGIYLSIFAATIWSCAPPIVKPEMTGTGFGFVYSTKDVGNKANAV